MNLLLIDTETTGLCAPADEPVEVAWAEWVLGQSEVPKVHSFFRTPSAYCVWSEWPEFFVKPRLPANPVPDWPGLIRAMTHVDAMLGFNVGFDHEMLVAGARADHVVLPAIKIRCFKNDFVWHPSVRTLQDAYEYARTTVNITPNKLAFHTAEADVTALGVLARFQEQQLRQVITEPQITVHVTGGDRNDTSWLRKFWFRWTPGERAWTRTFSSVQKVNLVRIATILERRGYHVRTR